MNILENGSCHGGGRGAFVRFFCRDLGFRSRARKVFLDEAKPRSTFKGSRRINLEILVRFWAFWVSGHRGRWSGDGGVWC